jgi:hypothetical protein
MHISRPKGAAVAAVSTAPLLLRDILPLMQSAELPVAA